MSPDNHAAHPKTGIVGEPLRPILLDLIRNCNRIVLLEPDTVGGLMVEVGMDTSLRGILGDIIELLSMKVPRLKNELSNHLVGINYQLHISIDPDTEIIIREKSMRKKLEEPGGSGGISQKSSRDLFEIIKENKVYGPLPRR